MCNKVGYGCFFLGGWGGGEGEWVFTKKKGTSSRVISLAQSMSRGKIILLFQFKEPSDQSDCILLIHVKAANG